MIEIPNLAAYLPVIMPELTLALGAMLLLMYGVFFGERNVVSTTIMAVAILLLAAYWVVAGPGDARTLAFGVFEIVDPRRVRRVVGDLVGVLEERKP
jgi:NADH-quinone oxidoreductase subunit N